MVYSVVTADQGFGTEMVNKQLHICDSQLSDHVASHGTVGWRYQNRTTRNDVDQTKNGRNGLLTVVPSGGHCSHTGGAERCVVWRSTWQWRGWNVTLWCPTCCPSSRRSCVTIRLQNTTILWMRLWTRSESSVVVCPGPDTSSSYSTTSTSCLGHSTTRNSWSSKYLVLQYYLVSTSMSTSFCGTTSTNSSSLDNQKLVVK